MRKKILCIVLIIVAFICYGIGYVLWEETLVESWIPLTICVGLALLTGLLLWKSWTFLITSGKFLPNYLCHVVFASGVLLCLFFVLNKSFSYRHTHHVEKAIVENKVIKKRHKTRRVGRRTYVSGETYDVYYWNLRFENGKIKEISAKEDQYRRSRCGDTICFEMEKGLFHLPVIVGGVWNVEIRKHKKIRNHDRGIVVSD